MTYIYATLAGMLAFALRAWGRSLKYIYPPDAVTYMHMSKGGAAPNPFRLRWLVPKLIGDRQKLWGALYPLALVMTCPLLCWFAELNGVNGLWTVALWCALPLWDLLSKWGGVVDPFSWCVALGAACLSLAGYTVAAFLAAIVAGMVAPKAVVFAALWSQDPWILVGLIPVAIRELTAKRGEPLVHPDVINHPWLMSMQKNGPHLHDMKNLLLPWGACLIGFMAVPLFHVVTLTVAYAQMFRAIDISRLYMWAAPVVIVATIAHVPEAYMPVAVIVTWFNPFRPVV